jgi:co-chaperonin GroES (HSP10)
MKMPKKFKVIGNNVLIKADLEADEYEGGIVVPSTCLVHDWRAEVIQAGENCKILKKHDIVLYKKDEAVAPFSETYEYRICKEKGIVAKLIQYDGNDYESIVPLWGWILCKPDVAERQIGGIHIPDKKVRKTYHAKIIRIGNDVNDKMFHVEQSVFFDTTFGMHCYENDEHLCLISVHDLLCVR